MDEDELARWVCDVNGVRDDDPDESEDVEFHVLWSSVTVSNWPW